MEIGALEVINVMYGINMAKVGGNSSVANAIQLSIAVTIGGSTSLKFTNGREMGNPLKMSFRDKFSELCPFLRFGTSYVTTSKGDVVGLAER